jgi:2-methylcitrate dehydratase PrpD
MTISRKGNSTISQQLAGHFSRIDYSTLNTADIAGCKALLLDYMGVALCGSATESGRLASGLSLGKGGTPEATVIGAALSVPADDAAFANAISAHSLELDDVDQEALFHFGPPVISAALATGEARGCSGRELIAAVICGCEMMERLSRAANPALRNRGFHTTAAAGVFGAAIACARLLKLNDEKVVSALGLAGAQASGLMEMYGSNMQKRFNPGPAARNGVTAARLAELGFTGADTIFEGERGFLNAFAGESAHVEALIPQAGSPYRLDVEFKAYACARPIHPAIDAMLTLRPEIYPHLSDIEGISIYRHPMWAHYHINRQPRSYHEAQVSLPYAAAAAMTEGDAFLDQFEQFDVMMAKIADLMGKITIAPEAGLPSTVSCRVDITLAGGKVLSSQVDYPKGSIQNPMTALEREAKFAKLAARVISPEKVREIIGLVNGMENIFHIRDFTKHLRF